MSTCVGDPCSESDGDSNQTNLGCDQVSFYSENPLTSLSPPVKSCLSAWSQELGFYHASWLCLNPQYIASVSGPLASLMSWGECDTRENGTKILTKHKKMQKDAKSVTRTSIPRETVSLSDGAADSTALFAASASSAIKVATENRRTLPKKWFFPFLSSLVTGQLLDIGKSFWDILKASESWDPGSDGLSKGLWSIEVGIFFWLVQVHRHRAERLVTFLAGSTGRNIWQHWKLQLVLHQNIPGSLCAGQSHSKPKLQLKPRQEEDSSSKFGRLILRIQRTGAKCNLGLPLGTLTLMQTVHGCIETICPQLHPCIRSSAHVKSKCQLCDVLAKVVFLRNCAWFLTDPQHPPQNQDTHRPNTSKLVHDSTLTIVL